MTDKEKAIVMAFTGITMLTCDKFQIFHEYIENIMGRPIYTHELANDDIVNEIKEKAKSDFIALCRNDCANKKMTEQTILNQTILKAVKLCKNIDKCDGCLLADCDCTLAYLTDDFDRLIEGIDLVD